MFNVVARWRALASTYGIGSDGRDKQAPTLDALLLDRVSPRQGVILACFNFSDPSTWLLRYSSPPRGLQSRRVGCAARIAFFSTFERAPSLVPAVHTGMVTGLDMPPLKSDG